MNHIIVTPKKEKDTEFLVTLLKGLDKVKSVKVKKSKVNEEALLSEKSLAKDWLSKEDDRWDEVLKK